MLTIAIYWNGCDTEIEEARWLTEEEKTHYKPEYRDTLLVGMGDCIRLPFVGPRDIHPDMKYAGSFCGCSNQVYVIDDNEKEAFIDLNNKRQAEKARKELQEQRKWRIEALQAATRQQKLYTEEEAESRRQSWINVENEGGEGYVPHFYTVDEVERLKKWLADHPE